MAGRIVVLISGTGSNMEALVRACATGEVPGEVVAVVADRECLGLRIAEGYDIPTLIHKPGEFSSREDWSAALRARLLEFEPDLLVSAGFMRILSPVFVDAFAGRLINLHPSLLPAFPGAHAVHDALEAGAKETGSTVHFIDHQVDHGPIIAQERVQIMADDDTAALHERIKEVEHRLLPRAVRMCLEGKVALPTGKFES